MPRTKRKCSSSSLPRDQWCKPCKGKKKARCLGTAATTTAALPIRRSNRVAGTFPVEVTMCEPDHSGEWLGEWVYSHVGTGMVACLQFVFCCAWLCVQGYFYGAWGAVWRVYATSVPKNCGAPPQFRWCVGENVLKRCGHGARTSGKNSGS